MARLLAGEGALPIPHSPSPAPREVGRQCHVSASAFPAGPARLGKAAPGLAGGGVPSPPGALAKWAMDRAQEKWDGLTGQSLYFKGLF